MSEVSTERRRSRLNRRFQVLNQMIRQTGLPRWYIKRRAARLGLTMHRETCLWTRVEEEVVARTLLGLVSGKGVQTVRFISEDEKPRPAASAISRIAYRPLLPGNPDIKIVRRGMLSCSAYTTPVCSFVLLNPAEAKL
jgi:hypothetical protein